MSLYSIDKLINETRRLAAEFKRTTGTMLPVSSEIARYDVSHTLGLILNEETSAGYDAVTNDGKNHKVVIKSRVVEDTIRSSHRVGQLNMNTPWDYIILSLMDSDFEPIEMYRLSRDKLSRTFADSRSDPAGTTKTRKNRNNVITVAKFKVIGELLWSRKDQ